MTRRLIAILEHPVERSGEEAPHGAALARVAEAHPDLEHLLDFAGPDPVAMAREIGMTYAYDPEDADDLAEIALSSVEWFEPLAGLSAVQAALAAVRANPQGIAAAIYDPTLRAADVLMDLEALERALALAQRHEVRFRFAMAA